jgi:hypothetical protein
MDLYPSLGIAWYLECGPLHVPHLVKNRFNSLEATGRDVLEGEASAGLDDKAHERLIAQNKVKGGKIKDALKKTRLKEVEKKKQDEKAKDKTEKGKGKKTNVKNEVTSTVLDEPASNRGTKRDSSHLSVTEEHLILGPVVVDLGDDVDVPVDEFIINLSLILLIPEHGPKPQAFCDVTSFIEKVMHLEPLIVL